MPPRSKSDTSDDALPTSGTAQFVVLSDGATIETKPEPENGKKSAEVSRGLVGQIITLDMSVVNGEKIQRLIDLKGLARYDENTDSYPKTTARVAVAAAGAQPDPVVAPVIEEDQQAAPVAATEDTAEASTEGDSADNAQ